MRCRKKPFPIKDMQAEEANANVQGYKVTNTQGRME